MTELTADKVVKAINEVAATEAGQVVFAYLKNLCGWDIVHLSNEDNYMHFQSAKRSIYSNVRTLIDSKYLKEIEFNFEKAVKNDRTTSKRRDK